MRLSRPLTTGLVLVSLIVATGVQASEDPRALVSERTFAPVQAGATRSATTATPYAAGRVLVKFSEQASRDMRLELGPQKGAAGSATATGLASVDQLGREVGASRIVRPYAPPRNRELARRIGVDRWYLVDVAPGQDPLVVADRYAADPHVEAATVDWRAYPAVAPDDPLYPDQWGHDNTAQMLDYCWGCGGHPAGDPVGTPGFDSNAEAAWDEPQGYGSSSVIIAILDSGVDAGHPDLDQVAGYDFGDNDGNPDDNSASPGHGTACAGVAAAISDNGLGVSGVAGGCRIMPLKVADSGGSLYFSYIQNGLYYAADNGADVASMSFGASISSDPATDDALQYAHDSGVTMFAATGNENASSISYPANNTNVVAVGAASPCGERKRSSSNSSEVNPGVYTDPNGYTCDGERWWGSNYGSTTQDSRFAVDVIAPTIMPTTDIQGSGGYDSSDYSMWFNGTSCATPYAAGVAALIISANPGFTPMQVRGQLTSTAEDVTSVESGTGWDRYTGYGMVDAAAAVGGGTPPADSVTLTAPNGGETLQGGGTFTITWTSTGTIDDVALEYSTNGGGTWTTITASTTNDGSYLWTVPATATTQGRVRVSDASDPGVSDQSNAEFTIQVLAYATLPYSTGFESGALDSYWTTTEGTEGRILVTSSYTPHSGSYQLTMDDFNNGGSYSQNEAWLHLDLAGQTEVDLEFWWQDFSDETHGLDGVYFSDDGGATFVKVQDLNGGSTPNRTWQQVVLDVDALAGGHGLLLTGTFVVKFQQYDNYAITTDGHGFDDVSVTGGAVGDPPVAAFTGSPTSGQAPLVVDFTDESTGDPDAWNWDFGDGGASTSSNPSHEYTAAGTYTVTLTVSNDFGSDDEVKTDYITVSAPPVSTTIGEIGMIARNQTGNGADWYTVALNNTYTDPVVVMRTLTTNGGHKTHLRVRDVTSSDFEWQMEEWDYHDGNHTTEDNPYLVMEAGAHTLADGTLVEAGTASIGTGWTTIDFTQAFGGTPVLLTGVASQNDGAAVVTRTRNLGASSFQIRLQEEEAADGVHADEIVSWIAIAPGVGSNDGAQFEAGRTPNAVEDEWYAIGFSSGMSASPIFLCHDDTFDGNNTCSARYRNASASGVEVFIEEEQSADSEVNHISEVVSWLVWASAGDIVAQGRGAAAVAMDKAMPAPLPTAYALHPARPNPFNPSTTIAFDLPRGGLTTIRVYDLKGRRVTTLVDEQLTAGAHQVQWHATDDHGRRVASGVYLYAIRSGDFARTQRMTLVK